MNNISKIYLAGGCFWCTEAVFKLLKGVESVVPGYTGGGVANPKYKQVCLGITGHAEAVEVTYNFKEISLKTLLDVFFLTHDPTTLNRQGNDIGTQYRSAIFCLNEKDINICNDYIKNLGEKMIFNSNIVTSVEKLNKFYLAEIEHKDYYNLNKNQPYCSAVIGPKVKKFINNKPKLIK